MSDRQERLRRDVQHLAGVIGDRNIYRYEALERAAQFIEKCWRELGLSPRADFYQARGHLFRNIDVELPGRKCAEEIVVVGAHYDTDRGTPGADDNASGVAAVLELSREFAGTAHDRTLRFVAFVNEERPFLRTKLMGSRVYARHCRDRGERIVAMFSLEMLGFCSRGFWSQKLSLFGLLTPRKGDFIAFVSNRGSRHLVDQAAEAFRSHSQVRCHTLTLPTHFPGSWSSDQWSFWREGYPGFMVSDTARLRNSNYHTAGDRPETLDYEWMAGIIDGLVAVTATLGRSSVSSRWPGGM